MNEKIQEMWEADSHMDMDNLHDESVKIPQSTKSTTPSTNNQAT